MFKVVCDCVIAGAYVSLTHQLYQVICSTELSNLLASLRNRRESKARGLYFMIMGLGYLFCSFISLCGLTHAFHVASRFYPRNESLQVAQSLILVTCAVVSLFTAIIGYRFFPKIVEILPNYELNGEGDLQHVESSFVEVLALVKESVLVLGEDQVIMRCNEASKALFGATALVDRSIIDFIHPEDVATFENAVAHALAAYSTQPVSVEYRVVIKPSDQGVGGVGAGSGSIPAFRSHSIYFKPSTPKRGPLGAGGVKIFTEDSTVGPSVPSWSSRFSASGRIELSAKLESAEPTVMWVESTICKGMRVDASDNIKYDLKMVSRNIDERRKQAESQYRDILRQNEEEARINAAKLRYISCIAHDLKTPVQSFCFSLDLLRQSALNDEQLDCVQQASVAVDLMKLTISQTMDISKALSGAKIQPRRNGVSLSSVIERVKIIINGYGKQVPINYDVASDIEDAIITDEEWLWQMLLNLLTNACKYTDRGGIDVVVRLSADMELPGSYHEGSRRPEALLLEVIDTGVGVSDDKIGHIFDAYSQLQEGQVTGTGLGLFGVRTRAEGLQGRCGARHNTASSTGTGTVLWFAIPYLPERRSRGDSTPTVLERGSLGSTPSATAAGAPSSDTQPGLLTISSHLVPEPGDHSFIRERQLTAIVVDDTLTVRKLMEKLLLRMGFARVDCYENGAKGLDAMLAGQVDIVFSDVQMPILTGPEMVSRFRKWEEDALANGDRTWPQLVVAVTANGADLGKPRVDNGFDEICAKPLSAADIQRVVQKLL